MLISNQAVIRCLKIVYSQKIILIKEIYALSLFQAPSFVGVLFDKFAMNLSSFYLGMRSMKKCRNSTDPTVCKSIVISEKFTQ